MTLADESNIVIMPSIEVFEISSSSIACADSAKSCRGFVGWALEGSRSPGMPKRKVLAAIVKLLETTYIRVGNEEYAEENNSFGLTTFKNQHVEILGGILKFRFRGKSAQRHEITLQIRDWLALSNAARTFRVVPCFNTWTKKALRKVSTRAMSMNISKRSAAPISRRRTFEPGVEPAWQPAFYSPNARPQKAIKARKLRWWTSSRTLQSSSATNRQRARSTTFIRA